MNGKVFLRSLNVVIVPGTQALQALRFPSRRQRRGQPLARKEEGKSGRPFWRN